jgi:Protein of unknown function (DUF1344)
MKSARAVLVVALVAFVITLAPMAWAEDVLEGKIQSVDPSGKMITLDDGTKLTIPPTLTIETTALQPGTYVKASYDEKSGQKVATSLIVIPPR